MTRTTGSPAGIGAVVAALAVVAAAMTGCTGTAGSPTADPAPAPATTPAAATTGGTPPTGADAAPGTGSSTLPPGLLLPDEGKAAPAGYEGWTTDTSPTQSWLLDPCRPTAYPTDAQRASFRTVSRTGPEAHDARQLAVYPTAEVAAEVLAGFRRALAACSTGGQPVEGSAWQWVTDDRPDLGDDGLVAASTTGGPTSSPSGDRIAVTRVGSAVFLAYAAGEYSSAEIDGGAAAAQEVAQQFLDSL